jgi:XTP/dITP diphosphohydrolase
MRLFVATSNAGKLRDFAYAAEGHLLHGERLQILPLPGLAQIPAPPEEAPTFAENARAKALYYATHAPGLLVLADDSGLEVTCLDGAPGVRSARFAADEDEDLRLPPPATSTLDQRNNAALLRALDGVPEGRRQARYCSVLALARDGEVLTTAEGWLEGSILTAPRGKLGFGYDPLFLVPERNQTMAELDPVTRLALSHRGRALRALLEGWQNA